MELLLDKPLRRGGVVASPERDKVCIGFKYEHLVGLCYQCGRIGHEVKNCFVQRDRKQGGLPYGEWLKAGYCRNYGNANKVRSSPGWRDNDVQADRGYQFSSQWKVNEQGNPAIGSGSGSTSLTQLDSLPEGGSVDGAPANGGVTVDKGAILIVKKHVLDFGELIAEIDRAIQTDLDFSNSKETLTNCVPERDVFDLIELVVMDEDTVTLNRDSTGKQGKQISASDFEGLEICFKVGCGNGQGNKSNSKGRSKRSGSKDKVVNQSMHSPKVVE